MGKPTNRIYKPSELGGIPRGFKVGFDIVLAQPSLQKPVNKTGTQVSIGKVAGAYGAFAPSLNRIVLTKDIYNVETIKHETGHAIDYKNEWISKNKDGVFRTGGKNAPVKDWDNVLVNRFNRYVTTKDEIKSIAALKRRVKPWYYDYMNSTEERFADAYNQYKTQPTKMKGYAPTVYKWFRSNSKLL